ncbi:type II secretion system protein N [Sphingomonas gellani]|uniref:type II secretion system protein N n=1 Tax=Sphingomonas gellani TaxID=1166340 RepID=UPI00147BAC75|nr:type II secretion system protein N [Sphingomonas gellani]
MTVEQTSPAAVTPHLKLFGVINTSAGGRAFIGFTGDDQHVYENGDRISAGSFLAEVRPDRVRISHAGWSEWLSLAGNPDASPLRPRDPESLRRESESRNAGALPYSQGVRHGRLRAGSPSVISSHEAR